MSKQRNTPEYRDAKRLTAFVDPHLKQLVVQAAEEKGWSQSKQVNEALAMYFYGDQNGISSNNS